MKDKYNLIKEEGWAQWVKLVSHLIVNGNQRKGKYLLHNSLDLDKLNA